MGTTTSAALGSAGSPTVSNPYGLSPSTQAFLQQLQGLSNQIGNVAAPPSANYMRPSPGQAWTRGDPNSLLYQILAMRASQALGLGAPYQQGVAMPRVSLLSG